MIRLEVAAVCNLCGASARVEQVTLDAPSEAVVRYVTAVLQKVPPPSWTIYAVDEFTQNPLRICSACKDQHPDPVAEARRRATTPQTAPA